MSIKPIVPLSKNEIHKKVSVDRFYTREKWEAKVEELINFRKEGMSVKEYTLKFNELSKYA